MFALQEYDPAKYLPEVTDKDLKTEVVQVNLNRPMNEILAQLNKYPITTRLSLSGRNHFADIRNIC